MNVAGHQSRVPQPQDLEVKRTVNNSISNNESWDYQVQSRLPNSDVILFRSRNTNQGVFDESEMQLVWQRANKIPLIYLVGSGHASYRQVEIRIRDDSQAVWVIALDQRLKNSQPIASLDLVSGEFQSEAVFRFPPPETAWSTIHQKEGVLIQEQLTWSQDKSSGVQHLYDHERGLVWEYSDRETWILKSGSPMAKNHPYPNLPYRMQAPEWVK